MVSVEGAVGMGRAGVQASRLALNVREELHDVLAEDALHGRAAQLLLLRAGVGLRGALCAVQHLVAGGKEKAGLRKWETWKIEDGLEIAMFNLSVAK